MPFYEYRCQSCGHELEALQKIADEHLVDCPECEGGALRRLVSAAAFRLKGGGWYETDFKTGSKRNVAGEDGAAAKPAAAADGKAPASSGDAKSAPTTETAKPAKTDAGKATKPSASPG